MPGLSRFTAAFRLSRKIVEKVFFGKKLQRFTKFMGNFQLRSAELIKNCNINLNSSSWQNALFKLLAITQNSHVKDHVDAEATITGQT